MDIDIGEVNVVRVVLEELSSSEEDCEDSSDEDAVTEKRSVDDGCYDRDGKEEGVEHNVKEGGDKEHQNIGDEEHQEEGDKEHKVKSDQEHHEEGDEDDQVKVDEDDQVKVDEDDQVKVDEDDQVKVDEDDQVKVDEDDQVKVDEDDQVKVMNTSAAIPIPVSKAPTSHLHQIDKARLSEGFFCICGYQSAHKFILQTHVRYYNVERNFACTACNHKSVTLPDLKSNMKAVHHITYDKGYGCRDCGACFDVIKELFYHLAEVHDNGPLAKSNQRLMGKVGSPIKANNGTLNITEEDTVISAQAAQEALLSLKLNREPGGMSQVVAKTPKILRNVSEGNHVGLNKEDPSIAIEVWNDEDELQLLEIQPEDEQLRLLEIETEDEDDLPIEEESTTELNASTMGHGLMGMFGNDSWLCICGTKFQTERSLRSHVLLKSGIKPFKCQHCNEAFPRRDYLVYHQKRCHGEESETISVKLFTCLDCGIQVKSRKKLLAHKANMHQECYDAAGMQLGQSAYAGETSTSRKRKYPQ